MNNKIIDIRFQCWIPWREPHKAFELIELFQKYEDVGLSPKHYGPSDARTFDLSDLDESYIEETWTKVKGGTFKAKKPWGFIGYVFYIFNLKGPVSSEFHFSLDQKYFDDEERVSRFLELSKDIYYWGKMDHGYIASNIETESKNSLGTGGWGGANLKISLPGIYWLNFFGPRYVNWLGAEKFEKLEVYKKEKLNDGGWMIFSRPDLLNYESKAIRNEEKKIIKLIGDKAFFEKNKPWKKLITPPIKWPPN